MLRGKELADLPCIENAYLIIEDDEIAGYGTMNELKSKIGSQARGFKLQPSDMVHAKNAMILPCWCDSHTHLVFVGSREHEFVDKIKGLSYADINAKGGGILNSSKKINNISEEELFTQSLKKLEEIARLGTGAVEIKSGYGLTVDNELKILRVIKRLKERSNLFIKSTFLGAHTYPVAYRDNHQGYIDLIINEMLPVIAKERLADYIDVFCEAGFFSPAETETICKAGTGYGLIPRLHVNQLNSIGGIETGIKVNAISLDHLETLNKEEIDLLSGAKSVGKKWDGFCTFLPTAAFFLQMSYPPARQLIDAGCAVALASDYNPGSSPSANMNFVAALSCIQMKMLPEEAINAATINGAYAMELGHKVGSITIGKKANLIFTRPVPSLAYLPYAFGTNLIDKVMIRGQFIPA